MSECLTQKPEDAFVLGGFKAWMVCLSSGLFFFYEFFQLNLFDVINLALRESFHTDAAGLSLMSSSYLWADILFLLPAGLILDRFSARTVILSSMALCVLSTLGFALSHSFALAFWFHFLSGIGNAFCFLSCVVLVSKWFSSKRQALVIGCLVTMAFLGGMMAHTPLAYLNSQFGWRNALLIDALLGLLFWVWIASVVKDSPHKQEQTKVKTTGPKCRFSSILLNPQNLLAGVYTACLNLPIMVLCALWGASYLQVAHKLSHYSASNVISLLFVGSIFGCPLLGWISDRMGRRKPLMVLGAVASLLTMMPLFLGYPLTLSSLSLLFFSLGFFTSSQVISYPLIAESNAPANTGTATGISSVIIMGGGGLAQLLFGLLMNQHALNGNYSLADFQYALCLIPCAILLAIIAVLFVRETYNQRLARQPEDGYGQIRAAEVKTCS